MNQQPDPYPPPQPQPYSYPQQPPMQPELQTQIQPQNLSHSPPIKKSELYFQLIIIGIVALLLGGLIIGIMGFFECPDLDDYVGDLDYGSEAYITKDKEYDEDYETYDDNERTILSTGRIVEHIGLIFLSIGVFMGAIKDDKLPPNVRLGMLVVLGLILAVKYVSLMGIWGYAAIL